MQKIPAMRIAAESLEYEQIPPLDIPEANGISWERQLSAVQAWQAAGGNCDNDSAQWESDQTSCERAVAPPTLRSISRLNTLLLSLRERLLQVQNETANIAISEMALRHTQASGVMQPEDSISPLTAENVDRFEQLARVCFEHLHAAQADLAAIGGRTARDVQYNRGHPLQASRERRMRAMVIDFADRRAAA